MASLTRRRMPSARASVPFSEMSCRTVFKRSDSVWWDMFGLELDVFRDTPTRSQHGPPSTSFSGAERLPPSGVRLRSARYARLRSASPRRGEGGGKEDNLQKEIYTDPVQGILPPAKTILGK